MSSVMVVIYLWASRHNSAEWPLPELTLNSQDRMFFIIVLMFL